jgi:hypothetical protein
MIGKAVSRYRIIEKLGDGRDARLMKEAGITSRLQKGGALLGDMRRLVAAWSANSASEDASAFVMRTLGKPSLARARDTFIRAFRPRFLNGNPPQAWKLARALEDEGADPETAKAFYFWITARSETVLYHYATDELMAARASAHGQIKVEDAMRWLRDRVRSSGKEWSPTVTRKVARGMLAALRDFGVLQGAAVKTIAPRHCPLEAFALIAFCLHEMGASGRALLDHPDWHLFLFDTRDVERALLECHQKGWLGYQAAGVICRIDLPSIPFKEYVRVVLGR